VFGLKIIKCVCLGVDIYLYFSPIPKMQQSMVQFCLPRVPFQRSHIKLWQPVCSAVKLLACRKKAQFPLLEKRKQEKVHSGTNKLDVAARGRLAVCFLDGNASKMLTQREDLCSNFSVMYLPGAHAKQARNSEG
jgi:hypothetical protein